MQRPAKGFSRRHSAPGLLTTGMHGMTGMCNTAVLSDFSMREVYYTKLCCMPACLHAATFSCILLDVVAK
eukprot:COSAG04_NODE_27433_length_283_cov_0.826087_2_plen_69_part_01